MAAEKSYARLGLFIVATLVVVLATALIFIQRLRSREAIALVTYTTENVSGLEISSPVRYRGVSIGRVTDVRVDPRGITVTGEAYLLLDVPENPPPVMELGFTPTRTYIPSMPSTLSTVQDRLPA